MDEWSFDEFSVHRLNSKYRIQKSDLAASDEFLEQLPRAPNVLRQSLQNQQVLANISITIHLNITLNNSHFCVTDTFV